MQTLGIGELSVLSGVGKETIRFYERELLMPAPRRTPSNYRRYLPEAATRLRFIRRAKELGFQLEEIRELLRLQEANGDRAQVKEIAERKLVQVRARLAELSRMEAALADMYAQCSGKGPVEGCPIIETLTANLPGAGSRASTGKEA